MRQSFLSIYRVVVCMVLGAIQLVAMADDHDTDWAGGAGSSPAETLTMYFTVLEQHNGDPALGIYTPATQRMLRDWAMTPAQMDNLLNTYYGCRAETARIDSSKRFAVIRYPVDERQCSPWFFELINGAWALDLTMMQRAIRFGRDNSWRFERNVEHPYGYAFVDWTFDGYGFPREK